MMEAQSLQELVIRCILKELGISLHGDIADIGAAEETVRMLPLPPSQKQMVLDYMANIFIQFVSELECVLDLSYGTDSDDSGTYYDDYNDYEYWRDSVRREIFFHLKDIRGY